jgi:hypothetical protein
MTIAISTLLLPSTTGTSPIAQAGEIHGRMIFTASEPYYELTDRNGTLNGQVTWSGSDLPMAWSFRMGPQVRAIVTSPMTCQAGHMQLPYHDRHVVSTDYSWHSTVRGHSINVDYTLYAWCEFAVNVGGKPGQAVLRFHFDYRMKSP